MQTRSYISGRGVETESAFETKWGNVKKIDFLFRFPICDARAENSWGNFKCIR